VGCRREAGNRLVLLADLIFQVIQMLSPYLHASFLPSTLTCDVATDDQGNLNNIMSVQEQQLGSPDEDISEAQPDNPAGTSGKNTDSADMLPQVPDDGLLLEVPVSELSVQANDNPVVSVPPTTSASGPARVTLSHELPTPPLSEQGEDTEHKQTSAGASLEASQEPVDSAEVSEAFKEVKSSSGPTSKWSRTG
jgi:hypothetical protein